MWQKIEQINTILRNQGKAVIQEKKIQKDGKIIGKIQYGYIPQAVFDAVNQVIGPENWKYAVLDIEIHESQVIASVDVFIRTDEGEWLSKGQQFGQSNIVKGNLGDAKKGAITDAIQKCFSLWSIGADAYAGKLEKVWKGQDSGEKPKTQAQNHTQQEEKQPKKSQNTQTPPRLEGVVFENKDGRLIARGKTYGKSTALKHAGFQWDPESKVWWKKAA